VFPSSTIPHGLQAGLVETAKSSTVLVISPVVALMIDQVKSLRSRDVKRCIMTSSSSCGVDKDLVGLNELTWY